MKIINNEFFLCGTFMDQVDFNPSILDNPLISNELKTLKMIYLLVQSIYGF